MADMKLTNQTLPQGQPNGLAEVKKYLTEITDEIAVSDALTNYMSPNPTLFKAAQSAGSFYVPTITTSALSDYDKAKGSTLGAVSTTFKEYTLTHDRARSFVLDGVDVMQQDGLLSASAVLAEFMRAEVVPEIDAVRISKCASTAVSASMTVSKAPAKASFLSDIITGINKVRSSMRLKTTAGMKIHLNDTYQDVLEMSSEYSRSKDIASGFRKLDTGTDMINQAEIIYTPAEYMKTAIDLNSAVSSTAPTSASDVQDGGFSASTSALDVAALIVAPGVANGLVASEAKQIFPEGTVPGVFGSQIDYRIFHDCIILENKKKGVYAITVPKGSSGSP